MKNYPNEASRAGAICYIIAMTATICTGIMALALLPQLLP